MEDRYRKFLDSHPDANELNAPTLLVEEFGIEYRIAVNITIEWVRMVQERRERC